MNKLPWWVVLIIIIAVIVFGFTLLYLYDPKIIKNIRDLFKNKQRDGSNELLLKYDISFFKDQAREYNRIIIEKNPKYMFYGNETILRILYLSSIDKELTDKYLNILDDIKYQQQITLKPIKTDININNVISNSFDSNRYRIYKRLIYNNIQSIDTQIHSELHDGTIMPDRDIMLDEFNASTQDVNKTIDILKQHINISEDILKNTKQLDDMRLEYNKLVQNLIKKLKENRYIDRSYKNELFY